MNKRTKLTATIVALTVFALPVFAGETNSPPCAPGEMSNPPTCVEAPMTSGDSVAPGEMSNPPTASSVDFGTLAEIALHSLLLF
jgi:hypothetical protein